MRTSTRETVAQAPVPLMLCEIYVGADVCPNCHKGAYLVKVKGCIRCLFCGFKQDCNGW